MDRSVEMIGVVTAGPIRRTMPYLVLGVVVFLVAGIWGNYARKTADMQMDKDRPPAVSAPTSQTAKPAGTPTQTAPAAPQGKGQVVVKINGLNWRVEPRKDAEVVDVLEEGDELVFLARQDGWVQCARGAQSGWVSERYVTVTEK